MADATRLLSNRKNDKEGYLPSTDRLNLKIRGIRMQRSVDPFLDSMRQE